MMNDPKSQKLYLSLALMLALGQTQAKDISESTGLLDAAGLNINDTQLFKKAGLTFGGWINAGATYNAANPSNGFNGPVTFSDRANDFQLNQLYAFLQKPVATEGSSFDLGGRVDFMFGTDSIFTQAYGVPAYDVNGGQALNRGHWDLNLLRNGNRFYDIALPQAYLESYIPIGNGLTVKAGHFYTPIGYEVVTAPDNFFYSHAYTMQYGEPFTHTGILGNYTVDSNWSGMAGVLTGSATGGWDGGFDRQLGNWTGIGGVTWNTDDKGTSYNISGTYGGTSEHSSNTWAMYSMVFKHNVTDKLHLVLQHDHGYADGVITAKGIKNTEWYGLNGYAFYDIQDNLSAGLRAEWFRDQDGFRTCNPGRVAAALNDSFGTAVSSAGDASTVGCPSGASYYAMTAGLTWKPLKWLNVRPNVRYDWADGANAANGAYLPFGNNKRDQFLFSTDAVISF